ncbi:hypothetical protein GCM10009665_58230 [Kitasatospora nipponensis]|uniref:Peptidase inhibitor family I36 n=1 Tax=Kitasatospora nipponensis TaxID=258049 RepID=A0ABN1WTY7_9ACTN
MNLRRTFASGAAALALAAAGALGTAVPASADSNAHCTDQAARGGAAGWYLHVCTQQDGYGNVYGSYTATRSPGATDVRVSFNFYRNCGSYWDLQSGSDHLYSTASTRTYPVTATPGCNWYLHVWLTESGVTDADVYTEDLST